MKRTLTKLDGASFLGLVEGGIRYLEGYRSILNDLNVFPVPDGDTGTNMVMTLRHGYQAVKDAHGSLSDVAGGFASAAVFGARGNSGVIVSQFFKGVAESFVGMEEADSDAFAAALQSGCRYAYAAVAHPVEGTILTVVKDASLAVLGALPLDSIGEVVDIFLEEARVSLQHTPELLPILKKAGVVDSGGSGIVYFFEGVKRYLDGELPNTPTVSDDPVDNEGGDGDSQPPLDLSRFSKDTVFDYGYCVEGVLQLRINTEDFRLRDFRKALSVIGESVVASLEGDKVKLHVHVKALGRLMDYCQRFGELLTVKIENMTVQHIMREGDKESASGILYDPDRDVTDFAVVAVATNPTMQRLFFDMGADVVILSEIAPSSQDFMDAFKCASAKQILVFPNSSNSILSSMQAGSLYKQAKVTVLNSRSLAECYACLSVMDFDAGLDEVVTAANDTLSRLYQVAIYHAVKDIKFGSRKISKNDFFALSGNHILAVNDTLESATVGVINDVLTEKGCDVVTLFYGKYIAPEYMEHLVERLEALGHETEFAAVPTYETVYDVTVTFE